jgi:hypothetical protein
VRESKAAQRLYKRVNRMISSMDTIVDQLHKEENKLISELQGVSDAPEEKKYEFLDANFNRFHFQFNSINWLLTDRSLSLLKNYLMQFNDYKMCLTRQEWQESVM